MAEMQNFSNNSHNSNKMCPSNISNDILSVHKDKISLVAHQLLLLLHSEECRQNEIAGKPISCTFKQCHVFQGVLRHLATCSSGKNCTTAFCFPSSKIISHYKRCKSADCPLCQPIRMQIHHSQLMQSILSTQKFSSSNKEDNSPNVVSSSIDWRSSLPDKKREKAMRTFVELVLPSEAHYAVTDSRMEALKEHVKKIERDIYVRSNSIHEYIRDMAGKCNKLIAEMNNKTSELGNKQPSSLGSSCSGTLSNSSSEGLSHEEIINRLNQTIENFPIKTEPPSIEASAPPPCENKDSNELVIKKEDEDVKPATVDDEKKSDPPKEEKSPVKTDESRNSSTKVWTQDELLNNFVSILDKVCAKEEAQPFLLPVNWVELDLPLYPKIVKNPMDLSTIRQKLLDGSYSEPWNVVDDFWLMFNNAWLFNKKNTKVYKICTKLSEFFEIEIDVVMKSLGFCCGRDHYFLPQLLNCCTVNMCRINRDVTYHQFKNEEPNKRQNLVLDRYQVCDRCFTDSCEYIGITDETTIVNVAKSEFERLKNNYKEPEPFVVCRECSRKWHKICACHSEDIWSKGFVCSGCAKATLYKKPENRFTAKKLATTKLSSFLENRVNGFLKRNAVDTGEVIIRVLASADKFVEIKPGMKKHYCDTGEISGKIPYRIKAIFAFQVIDGFEVCFFGLHVQEYGSDCPHPNTRRVYIAYLDSVYFFQPKEYRTDMYHEILLGYFDYAKRLGYTAAHIWACPPSEGDDYIFHMHPPDQKIPKPKRLQEWYQKMLKKAHSERIVADYKDVFSEAVETKIASAIDVPYFEGDYWPNQLEEIFKEVEDEEAKRKKDMANNSILDDDEHFDGCDEDFIDDAKPSPEIPGTPNSTSQSGIGKKQKAKKRRMKKISANGKRKRIGANGSIYSDPKAEISRKIMEAMEKHKENFFSIRLMAPSQTSSLGPINDTDPLISSEMMECRDNFLNKSRDKHLEFSTLRRAKYSTLCMLYEIHTEDRQNVIYTCNYCSETLENVVRYHCSVCLEFDLCAKCYEAKKHNHRMKKISADDKPGVDGSNEATAQETQREKINRLVKVMEHASSCRDANCRFSHCMFMKKLIEHSRAHNITDKNQCTHCSRVFTICLYHAKICTDSKCTLVYCAKMKSKMEQEQKQQRLQQLKMLRRRMAAMQRSNNGMTPNQMNNWQSTGNNNAVGSPGMQSGNPGPSPGMNSQPNTPYGGPGSMQSPQQMHGKMSQGKNINVIMNNPSPSPNLPTQVPYVSNQQNNLRLPQPNQSSQSQMHQSNFMPMNSNNHGNNPMMNNPNAALLHQQQSNHNPNQMSMRQIPTNIPNMNNNQMILNPNQPHHLHNPHSHPQQHQFNLQQHHSRYSQQQQQQSMMNAPNDMNNGLGGNNMMMPPFSTSPSISSSSNAGPLHNQHMQHMQQQQNNNNQMMMRTGPNNPSNMIMNNNNNLSQQQHLSSTSLNNNNSGSHQFIPPPPSISQMSSNNSTNFHNVPQNMNMNNHHQMMSQQLLQKQQQQQIMMSQQQQQQQISLSHEDIKLVQQTHAQYRALGRSINDFQMWLNSKPVYMKAWHFIQQQQQQHQQQQHQNQMQNNNPQSSNWAPPPQMHQQQAANQDRQFRHKMNNPNNQRIPQNMNQSRFLVPPNNNNPGGNGGGPSPYMDGLVSGAGGSSTSLSQLLSPNNSSGGGLANPQPPPGLNVPTTTYHHHPNPPGGYPNPGPPPPYAKN